MIERCELPLYTDIEVETHFSISVSKLRSAQRLHLVEAELGDRNRRHVRLWRADSVLRVWTAELMSRYTGLPFNVTAGIGAASPPERWEPLYRVAFGDGEHQQIPIVLFLDRQIVLAQDWGGTYCFMGTIRIAADNRQIFEPGSREVVPEQHGSISETKFCMAASTVEFCEIFTSLSKDA